MRGFYGRIVDLLGFYNDLVLGLVFLLNISKKRIILLLLICSFIIYLPLCTRLNKHKTTTKMDKFEQKFSAIY